MAKDPRTQYNGSTKWSAGAKPPASGAQPGTVALYGLILDVVVGVTGGGIYNPRRTNTAKGPGRYWSIHASGRAMDIMTPTVRPDGFPAGNALAAALVAAATELGIQQIMWAGKSWRNDGKGWRKLSASALPHFDHLHIEMNLWGAKNVTRSVAEAALNLVPSEPRSLIRRGDTGAAVAVARAWLGDLTPGDTFDDAMLASVRAFQTANHLSIDGMVGPQTWVALTAKPSRAVAGWYRTLAGREPDPSGHAYWAGLLSVDDDQAFASHHHTEFANIARANASVAPAPVPPPAPAPPVAPVAPTPPSGPDGRYLTRDAVENALSDSLGRALDSLYR